MAALSSFPYNATPHPPGAAELGIPSPPPDVPKEILDLNGQDAVLVGFMVPIDMDRDGVSVFALSQNRAFCCYGVKPALNEMVLVRMKGDTRTPFRNDTPITVFGRLTVQEERNQGHVVSLYQMQATEVLTLVEYAQKKR